MIDDMVTLLTKSMLDDMACKCRDRGQRLPQLRPLGGRRRRCRALPRASAARCREPPRASAALGRERRCCCCNAAGRLQEARVTSALSAPRATARPAHALYRSRGEASAAGRCPLDGYVDASKGFAFALRGTSTRAPITKIEPICALQACMKGFQVVTIEPVASKIHIFISDTGYFNIIPLARKKHIRAVLGGELQYVSNEVADKVDFLIVRRRRGKIKADGNDQLKVNDAMRGPRKKGIVVVKTLFNNGLHGRAAGRRAGLQGLAGDKRPARLREPIKVPKGPAGAGRPGAEAPMLLLCWSRGVQSHDQPRPNQEQAALPGDQRDQLRDDKGLVNDKLRTRARRTMPSDEPQASELPWVRSSSSPLPRASSPSPGPLASTPSRGLRGQGG
jgi:hypothetical protein